MDTSQGVNAGSPEWVAAANAYYQSRYAEMVAKYVGPGKRFADENQFRNYVGGIGKGGEQFFGGGVYGDSDTDLKTWAQIGQAGQGHFSGVTTSYADLMKDGQFRTFLEGFNPKTGTSSQDQGQATYEQWRDQVMQRLDAFSKDMNKPLDQLIKEGDLGAISASNTGANQAASAGYAAGVGGGGLSTANTQRAQLSAGLGYQQNRQALGLQATGNLMSGLQNQTIHDQDVNMQMQNAQANAEAYSAQQKQQMWQAAGSVLGGVAGGAMSYGNGGSFSSGYQTGSNIGGGLGGLAGAQGYQPYSYHAPTSPRPRGLGSGSGSSYYGGSQ